MGSSCKRQLAQTLFGISFGFIPMFNLKSIIMKNLSLFLFATLIIGCGSSQTKEISQTMDISMFPKAKNNEVQRYISLKPLNNEENYKVELFITKEMEVDCNQHSLQCNIEVKDLQGWGYDYYIFKSDGKTMSTMMMCPETSKTKKDIPSDSKLIRYNSKLPIVVYLPEGYKLKYKIWSSGEVMTAN